MRALPEPEQTPIGQYRPLAELGEGAMGRVLLARGPLGRLAAVKQVHPHLLADKEFRARFRSEVAACRKVASAYAVPVIDADTEAAEPWFASAFTPGPTLAGVLAAGITLPEPAILRLAAGLAAALADFAAAGVIHRDLKPSNILLAADGPRVLDFGIARAADPLDGPGLTRTGWLLGTPAYMSPEQARAKVLTAASDVFSLGSVLVAAHTGAAPFDDPETLQAMYNVVHAKADLTGLPPRSRRLVSRCLAKQPDRRPTAAQLLELIGEVPAAERQWPQAVHDMITAHNAELADLVQRHPDRTTVIDAGETLHARLTAVGETVREADPVADEVVAQDPEAARTKTGAVAPAGPAPTAPASKPQVRKRRSPLVAAAVLAVIAVVMSLGGLIASGFATEEPNGSQNSATQAADDGGGNRDFEDAYEDFEPDEPDSDAVAVSVGDLPEPCSHVEADVVLRFGLRDGDSDTQDAWKSCHWLATPEGDSEVAGINLGFATGPYSDDDGGEPVHITGLPDASVHRDEKPGSCTVQWPVSFGYILVTGVHDEEDRTGDACTLAEDFATAALPGLPD